MYGRSAGTLSNIFEATGDGAQRRRIKGGSQQISTHLQQNIVDWKNGSQVLLNEPVLKIAQTTNVSVDVSTVNGKKYRAKYAIVSIPPAQVANVQFDPVLPEEKRQLFRSFPMGNLLKFVATYSKAFWRDQGYSGEVVSTGWTDSAVK